MMPSRIILIGYMGSGKTTVGKVLSRELNLPFYDLDWYIENRMHKSIHKIFEEKGEEGFSKIERNLLHDVAQFENVIISCGGGATLPIKERSANLGKNLEYRKNIYGTKFNKDKQSEEYKGKNLKIGIVDIDFLSDNKKTSEF